MMEAARYLVVALMLAAVACSDTGSAPPADATAVDLPPARDGQNRLESGVESGVPADTRVDAPSAPDTGPSPCPPLMALVDGAFCVDRYEAALEEQSPGGGWVAASPYLTVGTRTVRAVPAQGIAPQGYISGTEAAAACAAAGKRLCSSTEWLAACRGPTKSTYPYGNSHQPAACNDDYQGHPVVKYFGTSTGIWDAKHMNDPGINKQPGTVAAGGAHPACVSHWGIFDLHGNLHEWVSDATGTFRGGFYADAKINGAGCLYATTAHALGYHDYSTGFRCCADRAAGP
jgi:Sulfatase-modifying factor enzyme 1